MTEKVERNSIQFKGGEGGEKKKNIEKKKKLISWHYTDIKMGTMFLG